MRIDFCNNKLILAAMLSLGMGTGTLGTANAADVDVIGGGYPLNDGIERISDGLLVKDESDLGLAQLNIINAQSSSHSEALPKNSLQNLSNPHPGRGDNDSSLLLSSHKGHDELTPSYPSPSREGMTSLTGYAPDVIARSAATWQSASNKMTAGGIPTGYAAALDRQVVEEGKTVSKIEGSFNNHTVENTTGPFVYNKGTISRVIADVVGNTHNNTSNASALIHNSVSGQISSITGKYINNSINSTTGGSGDDGIILYNYGTIDNIQADFIGNSMVSNSSASNPNGAIYAWGGIINNINSNFVNNSVSSAQNESVWAVSGAAILVDCGAVNNINGYFYGNSVTNTGINKAAGGAIVLKDAGSATLSNTTIGDVNGIFVNNSATSNTGSAYGGAIYIDHSSGNTTTVNRIGAPNRHAIFAGNKLSNTSTGGQLWGGAIYNNATITNGIWGDFIYNTIDARDWEYGNDRGGAIYNAGGTISSINGNFVGNTINRASSQGGALFLQNGSVNSINGDFINNSAGHGSAIYVHRTMIGNISGNFIGNSVMGPGGIFLDASGGAVTVDSINANFINNSGHLGSAIYNVSADTNSVIKTIGAVDKHAMFMGNRGYSTDDNVFGGAIYNQGKINNLYGDFINNSATSSGGYVQGGAIYNYSTGTIGNLTGEFKSNIASTASRAEAGAIYNAGTMNISDSYFNSNRAINTSGDTTTENWAQGGAIVNTGTMNITDSSFWGNDTNFDAATIRNCGGGNLTISSVSKDVLFNGNGLNNPDSTLNLNAKAGTEIALGSIAGDNANPDDSIININADATNKGGKYVFNNFVAYNQLNLNNGADLRFGKVTQLDGTTSYGVLGNSSITNDEHGGMLNFANNNTTDNQTHSLRNLTLNSDLKIGIDANLFVGRADKLEATNVTANGHKILVDYINAISSYGENNMSMALTTTEALKPVFGISDTVKINSEYEWGGYSASYNEATGVLTLTKVDTGTENLKGFLVNNTTDSVYEMERDEQVLGAIDAMAGTDKTVNANGYHIYGGGAGITLSEGQAFTLNDAVVEGFYADAFGAFIGNEGAKLTINNSVFRNNTVSNNQWGGTICTSSDSADIIDSSFYNNSVISGRGGALAYSHSVLSNVIARTKDSIFEGNTTIDGGAIWNDCSELNVVGENGHKVIFSNNHAAARGGAIGILDSDTNISNVDFLYNDSSNQGGAIVALHWSVYPEIGRTLNIDNTNFRGNSAHGNGGAILVVSDLYDSIIKDSKFEFNTAGDGGGAIHNSGNMTVVNSTFSHNSATNTAGAIYNRGTLSILGSSFDHNNVLGGNGGAIYNIGTITNITDTTFTHSNADCSDPYNNQNATTGKGGAIYNQGHIQYIEKATFKDNTLVDVFGGFIYNAQGGTIDSIDAAIYNNTMSQDVMNREVPLILNYKGGHIGAITGRLENNNAVYTKLLGANDDAMLIYNFAGSVINSIDIAMRDNSASGLASNPLAHILNYNNSEIGSLRGVFSGNTIKIDSPNNYNVRGAVYASGLSSTLGEYDGIFTNNAVISYGQNSVVGSVYYADNSANVTDSINGLFMDNYVQTNTGTAYGGAISNGIINPNVSHIGTIGSADRWAKFIGNHADSNSNWAHGGAISNVGTIDSIYADFIGNYAKSITSYAVGGAIYNLGTINNLTGNFKQNYAEGVNISDRNQLGYSGGVIHNQGSMKISDSLFTDNRSSTFNKGNVISNYGGKMIIDGSVFNRNLGGSSVGFDGTIFNTGTLNITNSIMSNNAAAFGGVLYSGWSGVASNVFIDNSKFLGNNAPYRGSMLHMIGNVTLKDSVVCNNTVNESDWTTGALYMAGDGTNTVNLIADKNDVVFKNNSNGANKYIDIVANGEGQKSINLNAAEGKTISFSGEVYAYNGPGNVDININKGGLTYDKLLDDGSFGTETVGITQQGGKYVFGNTVSGATMNLFDGADVRLIRSDHSDGSRTTGILDLVGFTSSGNGNILSTINAWQNYNSGEDSQPRHDINLGNVVLNADTIIRADMNISMGDVFRAASFNGSGAFVLDRILFNQETSVGGSASYTMADSVLKDHIRLASDALVYSTYKKGDYTASYDAVTGNLTITRTGNGVYNLAGFLAQDTTGTIYTMSEDETFNDGVNLTMVGTNKTVNAGDYTVYGNGRKGIFVNGGQTLTINGGTWNGFYRNSGGEYNYGSTLSSKGTLTVDGATFENNIAENFGGAIFSYANAITTIKNSLFKNNVAQAYSGGAILNRTNVQHSVPSTMVIENSTFIGNRADATSSIKTNLLGGGAIENFGNLTIKDSIFRDNTTSEYGGAILNLFDNISNEGYPEIIPPTLRITAENTDVIFDNNTAAHGGAIHQSSNATTTIEAVSADIVFSNNIAYKEGAVSGHGGAICNDGDMDILATGGNITFKNNQVTNAKNAYGGAIYTGRNTNTNISAAGGDILFENNSTYINNVSTEIYSGGAIRNDGTMSINSSDTHRVVFRNNSVTNDTNRAWGGAIANTGHITNLDADFYGNSAVFGDVVNLYDGLVGGAAIVNYDTGIIDAIKGTFENNYNLGKSSRGIIANYRDGAHIGTIDGIFRNNYSIVSSGNAYGGVIWSEASASIDSINGTFENNYIDGSIPGGGAVANLNNSTMGLVNGIFTNNHLYAKEKARGGAILNGLDNSGGRISVINSIGTADNYAQFRENYVDSKGKGSLGGVIYNDGKIGSIYGNFSGNYSRNIGEFIAGGGIDATSDTTDNSGSGRAYGGAIYNSIAYDNAGNEIANSGVIDSISGTFANNYALSENGYALGGAIYNDKGLIKDIHADFTNNYAQSNNNIAMGGAIYNSGTILNVTGNFSGNYVKDPIRDSSNTINRLNMGGVIHNGGNMAISDSTFTENNMQIANSVSCGSVIGNIDGNMIIKNTVFDSNHYDDNGLIYNENGYMSIIGSTISNNVSGISVLYNGLYSNPTVFVDDSIFDNNTSSSYSSAMLLRGNGTIQDTQIVNNRVLGDTGLCGAVWVLGDTNIIANNKDVKFSNNYSEYFDRYIDLRVEGTTNLNADYDKKITFDGEIISTYPSSVLNLNSVDLNYSKLVDDGTFAKEDVHISQAGGQYVFNNNVVGLTMNVLNDAHIKLGSVEQQNGTTTYGTLNLNGFTTNYKGGALLDTINNHIETNRLGAVNLETSLNYNLDIDFNTQTADLLSATSYTGDGKFIINDVNLTGFANPARVKLANSVLIEAINTDYLNSIGYITAENGLRFKFDFDKVTSGSDDEQGLWMNTDFYKLSDAVRSTRENESYTLFADAGETYESVDRDLGAMQSNNLTIIGNEGMGLSLDGNGFKGMSIGEGKTATIKNIYEIYGFEGPVVSNSGTLNIGQVAYIKNDVENLGNIVVKDTGSFSVFFEENVYGSTGSIELVSGSAAFNSAVTQQDFKVREGASAAINDLSNFKITNAVSNAGTLALCNGNLASSVTGDGMTLIYGNVVNNDKTIAQKDVAIFEGNTLTTNAGSVIATDGISNSGIVYLTGGTLASVITGDGTTNITGTVYNNDKTITQTAVNVSGRLITNAGSLIATDGISNSGIVDLTGGTLASIITGDGTTNITGTVYNNDKTITQTAVNLTKTGNLTTNAGSVVATDGISNSGIVNLSGGTLASVITGDGTTNITGTVVNNDKTITQNAVNLTKTGNLTTKADSVIATDGISNSGIVNLSGGTLASIITGDGTTNITGTVYNNDKTITQNAVSLTKTGNLTTDAGSVVATDGISNSGIVNLNGGTLASVITGDGTTNITGSVVNTDKTINQNNVVIENNAKLTTNAGSVVSANGITNRGTVDLTGGTLASDISSVTGDYARIIISGVVLTGDKTITQDDVNVSGTLTTNADSVIAYNGISNTGTINLGDGTLASSISGSGSTFVNGTVVNTDKTINQKVVNVVGALTTRADAVVAVNGIANSGTIDLTGGTLASNITGTGSVNVTSDVTSAKNILQHALSVAESVTLTNSGEVTVNDTLTNNGTIVNTAALNVKGNNSLGKISDSETKTGSLNLDGTITADNTVVQKYVNVNGGSLTVNESAQITADRITNSGTITANADSLAAEIDNGSDLILTGGNVQGNIRDNSGRVGNVQISNEVTLGSGKSITNNNITLNNNASLKLFGGDISNANKLTAGTNSLVDTQDGTISNINLGNLDLTVSDLNIGIDADLANERADKISVKSVTGSNNIIISSINILTDALNNVPLVIDVADDSARNHITLAGSFSTPLMGIKDSYLVTYDSGSAERRTGQLTFEFSTLEAAVKSLADQKTFVMGSDETILEGLTPFGGSTMNVSGNGHSILGNGKTGITVSESQTFGLTDATVGGFAGGVFAQNAGNLKLTNVTVTDEIQNAGTQTLRGSNTIGKVSGEGLTEITSGSTNFTSSVTQRDMTIAQGASATIGASNLQITNAVQNAGSLNLNDGTLASSIAGGGTTNILGTVVNTDKTITQNSVNVSGSLTTKADAVIAANGISNAGTLNLNDGTLASSIAGGGTTNIVGTVVNSDKTITQNAVTVSGSLTTKADAVIAANGISNAGTLNLNDGTLASVITGDGTTNILGTVVNSDKTITQNGVTVSGSLTTKADAVISTNGISNSGSLNLNDGTLASIIKGDGTTNIVGTVVNNDKTITQNAVNVSGSLTTKADAVIATNGISNAGTLNLNDGTLASIITGDGTTNIVGTVVNNDKTITQNGVTVSGSLTTKADAVIATNGISNSGIVNLNDGTLASSIAGGGTTNIVGTVVNNDKTITQNGVNITGALTTKADAVISTNGISNSGSLNLNDGTLASVIKGGGTTNIVGTVVNSDKTITQNAVNVSGSLTTKADAVISTNGISNAGTLNLNDGTLASIIKGDGTTNIVGTVVNSDKTITQNGVNVTETGALITKADSVIASNGIDNDGTINFNGGTLASDIKGVGTTNIKGSVTNTDKSITQKSLVIDEGAVLRNNASDNTVTVTNGLTNNGEIANNGNITLGTLAPVGGNLGKFSGNGNLTLNGGNNITYTNNSADGITQSSIVNNANLQNNNILNSAVTNIGTMTSNADNIKGIVNNAENSILTLTGGSTTKDITGSGRIEVQNEVTLNNSAGTNSLQLNAGSTLNIRNDADITDCSSLIANGGTIDFADGNTSNVNLGNVDITKSNLNIAIDADLSTAPIPSADVLSANSVNAGSTSNKILISEVNLLHKSAYGIPVDVLIADNSIMGNIDLAAGVKTSKISAEGESYMMSYSNTTGMLNFSFAELAGAVKSDSSSRVYNMAMDEEVEEPLGEMNGGTLTVNGNNFGIDGNGYEGITVGQDKELYISDVGKLAEDGSVEKSYTGFDTAITVNDGGKTTIENSIFDGNNTAIDNDGELVLKGNNIFNDKIASADNNGSTTVADGTTDFNNSVTQKEINVDKGATANLNKSVEANVNNSGTVNNKDTLTGDVANKDKDAMFNNKGTVAGNVSENSGTINNEGSIDGNVNTSGIFKNLGEGIIKGDVENTGDLSTKLNNILGTIANDGNLNVSGGTTQNDITGSGTLNVHDNITNKSNTITQGNINITKGVTVNNDGTVNVDKSLTNAGNIKGDGALNIGKNSNVVNGGLIQQKDITIESGANVKTLADKLVAKNDISNDGNITYLGGKLDNNVKGSGAINLGDDPKSSKNVNITLNSVVTDNVINLNNAEIVFGPKSDISNNAGFNANAGKINVMDGKFTETNLGNNVTVNGKTNISLDFNLEDLTTDTFKANITGGDGKFNVDNIKVHGSTFKDNIKIHLGDTTKLGEAYVTSNTFALPTILTPIRKIAGRVEDGYLMYAPTGNTYRDYNPAILATPIAAQFGGYLNQINSYEEAFRNVDMKMLMTSAQRNAWKLKNKYAIASSEILNLPLQETDKSLWARPYAAFEHVKLNHGPKVNNTMYGTFFGGDSDMKELRHGWDYQWSAYVGYNGSHQTYDGGNIYQNGGNAGVTSAWYKGNFFTALTVNSGASIADESTMYGSENVTMIMGGVASKTGYNIELAEGKFIIQPSYLMSYSFVQSLDYTNNAGVKIDSKPLNGIQMSPGLKFIGNFNGWQPYASVNMVWNTIDKTRYTAANIALPEMSVKPYIQYGLGVQRIYGDRFTGYLQAMARSGGRNGVALSAGFKWMLDKDNNSNKKEQVQKAPVPGKTVVKQLNPAQKATLGAKNTNTTRTTNAAVLRAL